jgi:hypothetical protein
VIRSVLGAALVAGGGGRGRGVAPGARHGQLPREIVVTDQIELS